MHLAKTRYVKKNRLLIEARNQKVNTLFAGIVFLSILFIILSYLFPYQESLVKIIIIILAILIIKDINRAGAILKAGGIGEERALYILKKLPKNYIIFNQREIPFYENSSKTLEIDFIIIGPTTLFIVEVKNKSGKICASKNDKVWVAEKHGKKQRFLNPLYQLDRQLKLLARFLTSYDIETEIHGLLLFVHKKCEINIPRNLKDVLFTNKSINGWIKKQNNGERIDQERIVYLLENLRRN